MLSNAKPYCWPQQRGSALRCNEICSTDTFNVCTMEKSGYCTKLVSNMMGVAYDCPNPDFHRRNNLQEDRFSTIWTPNAADEPKDLSHFRRIYLTASVIGAALQSIDISSISLSSDLAVLIVYYLRVPKLLGRILEFVHCVMCLAHNAV
ncbi:predicted protein [Sclerotinia sclerotiorum 1980 UF-70]|uniref:Uncharacterized protein n=2 Tax=Sclerotinia sclerotiorum (strain ATCC 18683 / 1980 / Ss-1) TaxID=665079 RepID=A7F5G3_SCLS1|nr:predicted protein [Sclerotinia sclerotiorum 1980 UF-70]APA06475.1 hypothetical protein sscle_02g012450 [Sclerotinia sclerotiorum 1980 UF-70]EDN97984.1 predicted protein [Sclerotinia sclerotiorum 1980 UF-70]